MCTLIPKVCVESITTSHLLFDSHQRLVEQSIKKHCKKKHGTCQNPNSMFIMFCSTTEGQTVSKLAKLLQFFWQVRWVSWTAGARTKRGRAAAAPCGAGPGQVDLAGPRWGLQTYHGTMVWYFSWVPAATWPGEWECWQLFYSQNPFKHGSMLDGSLELDKIFVQRVVTYLVPNILVGFGWFILRSSHHFYSRKRKVLEYAHHTNPSCIGEQVVPLESQVKPMPLCNYRHVLKWWACCKDSGRQVCKDCLLTDATKGQRVIKGG